tara:strand:+ start:537 stop:767 length:231 start_codon:yes stop_codon:yes gene_type:complete
MKSLKTHYETHELGSPEAQSMWENEQLIPDKVKFCDGLMMRKGRELNFTKDVGYVDCKKCQNKIDLWAINRLNLPY